MSALDQDWAELREWFLASNLSDGIDDLLELDPCEFRAIATDDHIDRILQLAGVAFYETMRRSFDRIAEDPP